MNKYIVEVTEILSKKIEVYGYTKEDALSEVKKDYADEKIKLDMEADFDNYEIKIIDVEYDEE